MTRIEYDLLRMQEPHLKLPFQEWLHAGSLQFIQSLTREQLIAFRVQQILTSTATDWHRVAPKLL